MSREQSTRRPKCPATGKQCQGSHPLQCFDGAACLRLQQEGRRERAAAPAESTDIASQLYAALDYVIRDLEIRAGTSGVVEIGHGAYLQAKRALEDAKAKGVRP